MKIGWRTGTAAAAAAAVGVAAGQAQAQTPEDIRRLDRMAMERAMTRPVVAPLPPPVSARPPEQLRSPRGGIWECRGTEPGLPIYSAPSADSRPLGVTQGHIAASAAAQDGFRMVMDYRGRVGFVPGASLGHYRSPVREGVQCTVEGLRRDGAPVFGFR